MRTFICEFWGFVSIVTAVVGIVGICLKDFFAKSIGWLAVAVLFICGITYMGSCKVTDVTGMGIDNAIQTLQESGLKVEVDINNTSGVVETQSYSPDEWVKKGTVILLNYKDKDDDDDEENQPQKNDIIPITTNEMSGTLNGNTPQKQYSYTPELSGIYRFDFDTDDVRKTYTFAIHDSKGNLITSSNNKVDGTTIELDENTSYIFTVKNIDGNPYYHIRINVPQPVKNVSGNQIVGSIKYVDQSDTYIYTAPTTGIYGLSFEINNVKKYYRYSIYDSKNDKIKSGNSQIGETSFELQAGHKYTIKVEYGDGLSEYKLTLGVPNEPMYITGNTVSGEIAYRDQENCYIFIPSDTREYTLNLSVNDVKKIYSLKIVDSINDTIKSTNSAIGETVVELTAGKQYKFYVSYYNGICSYSIDIDI